MQPAVEGLDLRIDPAALSNGPPDVWLIDDRSAAGVDRFVAALRSAGYADSGTVSLGGVLVRHFHRGPG